jgi:hypothetical protein
MNPKNLTLTIAIAILGYIQASAQMGTNVTLEISGSASSPAKFRDSSEELKIRKGGVSASIMSPLTEKTLLMATISSGLTEYDFSETERWGDVVNHNAMLFLESEINDKWNTLGAVFLGSSYDKNETLGDGFTWGGGLGFRYKYSETLNYVVGVAYMNRLEGDSLVIPLVGIEWQITDRLTLDGLMGLELSYDLWGNGKGILSMGFDYMLEDFRISNDPISGAERAVRPEGFGVSLRYMHMLTDNLGVHASISGQGEQEFETRMNDRKVDSFKTESSYVYGIGLQYTF